jgi:hypothetical protein
MRSLCLALLVGGCAALPPPCDTADLDAQYLSDLALWCQGVPREECPAAPELAERYERDAADRIRRCRAQ